MEEKFKSFFAQFNIEQMRLGKKLMRSQGYTNKTMKKFLRKYFYELFEDVLDPEILFNYYYGRRGPYWIVDKKALGIYAKVKPFLLNEIVVQKNFFPFITFSTETRAQEAQPEVAKHRQNYNNWYKAGANGKIRFKHLVENGIDHCIHYVIKSIH